MISIGITEQVICCKN